MAYIGVVYTCHLYVFQIWSVIKLMYTHLYIMYITHIKMNNDDQECPICYLTLSPKSNYVVTSCKHAFCMNCFISSVRQYRNCPCCRTELYDYPKDAENTDVDNTDADNNRNMDDEDNVENESDSGEDGPNTQPTYYESHNGGGDERILYHGYGLHSEGRDYNRLQRRPRYYETLATLDEIASRLSAKGFTMADTLKLTFTDRKFIDDHKNNYHTFEYISEIAGDTIYEADQDAIHEYYENIRMQTEEYNAISHNTVRSNDIIAILRSITRSSTHSTHSTYSNHSSSSSSNRTGTNTSIY